MNKIKDFVLTNLIPKEALNEFGKHFAKATGLSWGIVLVPSVECQKSIEQRFVTCMGDTPSKYDLPDKFNVSEINMDRITPIFQHCDFCDLVRQSPIGNFRCWCSDLRNCRSAFQERTVVSYKCHMGLNDMVATIRVGGRHMANVYAGQVWTEIDEDTLKAQYNNLMISKLGVNFPQFKAKRDELHHVSEEQLTQAKNLLSDLAELISERATVQAILQVLCDIGGEISRSLNIQDGLLSFLKHSRKLINSNTGSIWLINSYDQLVPAAIDWALKEELKERIKEFYNKSIPVGEGLVGKVFKEENALFLKTQKELAGIQSHFNDSREIRELCSFIGIPIVVGGCPIGVFEVGANIENAFRDTDVTLLNTLASHAGAFIQSVRLSATIRDIVATRNFRDLTTHIVQRVPDLVNGKGCSLFLRQKSGEGNAYLVASFEGLPEDMVVSDFFSEPCLKKEAAFYEPGEGLTGWVLETGKILNLKLDNDVTREQAISKLNEAYKEEVLPHIEWKAKYHKEASWKKDPPGKEYFTRKAWVGAPLYTDDGKVLGVLRISERRRGNFTQEECSLLEALTKRITRAIAEKKHEIRLQAILPEIVMSLAAAVDSKDPYTKGHSQNVRGLSLGIGKEMGLGEEGLRELEIAALLHDIGKIGIPDAILSKASSYTTAERKCMEAHPMIGHEILLSIQGQGMDNIREGVLQHHERIDGKGYPNRLKGDEISLFGKIIAVADSFDAITTKRPYKDVVEEEKAFDELKKCAQTQFDQTIVDKFVEKFGQLYKVYKPLRATSA